VIKLKEMKMGWRRWEIHTEFLSENMKARDVDGRILMALCNDTEMGYDGVAHHKVQ
jgi:hypothetical protein